MATFKICVFKHQKRGDGKYPVSIRVCWKRKYSYIKTEYYVTDAQIEKKSFQLKDPFIISKLSSRIAGFETLKQKIPDIHLLSSKEIAMMLQKDEKNGSGEIDFIAFSRKHIERLKNKGRIATAGTFSRTVNALIDFAQWRENIPVSEVTSKFLQGFADFLSGPRALKRKNQFGNTILTRKKGLSDVSITDYLTDVRTLFNAAMDEFNDEDNGEIVIRHYPFRKFKIKRPGEPERRNLTADEIRKIKNIPDEKLALPRSILARDVFLLSFYLAGTNFADLYDAPASSYTKGRFSYQRRKTKARRQDNAFISIAVQPEAKTLFDNYRDKTGKRVFDFYNRYTDSHIFTSNINKGLKRVAAVCGIDKPVSTYYARHSIATIARNDCNVPLEDIHLMLNHVDEKMRITDRYIKKDWSRIDNAVRKVIDLINGVNDLL